VFGSTTIGVRRLLAGLGAALAAVLLVPAAAHAADETIGLDVPSAAVSVWVDIEQAGLAPADVVVTVSSAGGTARTVALTRTTFGLHGELAATTGRASLRVAAATGAATTTPDVSLTAVDAAGVVVGTGTARVRLVAGEPAAVLPGTSDSGTSDSGTPGTAAGASSGGGALAVTGGGIVGIGLAVALLVAGAGLVLWRRLARRDAAPTTEGATR
jgi:hypothetical protein